MEINYTKFTPNTASIYRYWIERYIRFLTQHKAEFSKNDYPTQKKVKKFLDQEVGFVSANYRNQAISALHFLYRQHLKQDVDFSSLRARKASHLPIYFTKQEFTELLSRLPLQYRLLSVLLAGSIPKLSWVLQLRETDISLSRKEILYHNATFPLPKAAIPLYQKQCLFNEEQRTEHGERWLFPGKNSPLKVRSVQWYFRKLQPTLPQPDLKPHTLCNTFWVWLWQSGATDYEILAYGKKLGYRTWSALERYKITMPKVRSPLD